MTALTSLMAKFSLCFAFLILPALALGEVSQNSTEEEEPPQQGNYALPTSQQPGPFVSFGQSIIEKNQVQFYSQPYYLKVGTDNFTNLPTSAVYGLSDSAALLLMVPDALRYRTNDSQSSGIGDIYAQGEWAFYEYSNRRYCEQMTVVGGITAPTGTVFKNPSTGYGASSYFLGTSYNRMSVKWLGFASAGLIKIDNNHDVAYSTQYLYQAGLGRNIKSVTDKYIFFGLVELTGTYAKRTQVLGEIDPDTGGNLFLITPSLWYSTKRLFFQLGISLPLSQALYGNQSKMNYNVAAVTGITFP